MMFLPGFLHFIFVMLMYHKHSTVAATRLGNFGTTTLIAEQHGNYTYYYRNLPCPNAEDIAPCICEVDEDTGQMDLLCVGIEDEDQLSAIFHADIPVPQFRMMRLDTRSVETLSENVFGDSTFESVSRPKMDDYSGILKFVDSKTFIKSASTLIYLDLSENVLSNPSSFPFDTIGQYSELQILDLGWNSMSRFPIIESQVLDILILNHNLFTEIPSGALDGLPDLGDIFIDGNEVESMPTGLFKNLGRLTQIRMNSMGLRHLESYVVEVTSPNIDYIDVRFNMLTSVEVDAFKGVHSWANSVPDIWLEYNQLTVLPEETWKPLVHAGVVLHLSDNDLTCGCDIAWLVLEPKYHEFIPGARCQSGDLLVDLDPDFFENNC